MSIIIGSGVAHIANETLDKATPYAAEHLGYSTVDISFTDSLFRVWDSNRSVGLDELVIKLALATTAHPFDI